MKIIKVASVDRHPEYSMSNMKSERTGLPGQIYIWISTKGSAQHGPRIKVSKIRGKFAPSNKDTFSVTISAHPKVVAGTCEFDTDELRSIYMYVLVNRAVLTEFWSSDTLDYEDIKPRLVKIHPV